MLAKTQKIIKRVALLGDSSAKRYQSHWQAAYQTAKILAQNGYIIVNGGGPGVMLAATLGAKSAKGIVELSIINPQKEPNNFESTHPGNLALADKVYIANTYQERLNRLIDLADAYICFKGGTGTLSEIGLTWGLAKFDYGRHEPLIFYGKFWKTILEQLKTALPLTKDEKTVYAIAQTPKEVLELLKNSQI